MTSSVSSALFRVTREKSKLQLPQIMNFSLPRRLKYSQANKLFILTCPPVNKTSSEIKYWNRLVFPSSLMCQPNYDGNLVPYPRLLIQHSGHFPPLHRLLRYFSARYCRWQPRARQPCCPWYPNWRRVEAAAVTSPQLRQAGPLAANRQEYGWFYTDE